MICKENPRNTQRKALVVLLGALLILAPMYDALSESRWPQESLFSVDLKFTDDASQIVQLSKFAGRPTILVMFYSSCKSSCPLLISKIIKLRNAAEKQSLNAQFVMVSFDAAHETADSLAHLRKTHALNFANLFLLRGTDNIIRELSVLLGVSYRVEQSGEIVHSNRLVLLNANGAIEKTFDGLDPDVTAVLDAIQANLDGAK